MEAYFRFPAMSDVLNKTGTPIFYSICNCCGDEILGNGVNKPLTPAAQPKTSDGRVSIKFNF